LADPKDETQDPGSAEETVAAPESETVTLSKKEHDRLQAEARRAAKALADRQKADQKRDEEARLAAQREAGEFDAALRDANKKAQEAEERAARAERRSEVADVIAQRGFTGSKASALAKLVGTDGTADEAVEQVMQQFPDLFSAAATPPADPKPKQPRVAGPATPSRSQSTPEGFISQEEYASTPISIRLTPEFQRRAKESEPYWPAQFNSGMFGSDN
jgi:hypothetical protein